MADKLLIILMNTDPANSVEVTAPLFQATVAASMEYEVEIVLTGRTGELARQGFAAQSLLQEGSSRSVYDLMQEAHEAGVTFKVCTPALGGWEGDLIPEIEETIGSAYVICEAMADTTVTFTY
jgi:predicted peroxiredoxin